MYLVGTIHVDLAGDQRLTRLLRRYKPPSVGIEWGVPSGKLEPSYEELMNELEVGDKIIKSVVEHIEAANAPDNMKAFANALIKTVGYEPRASIRLKRELGYRLYCLDYDNPEAQAIASEPPAQPADARVPGSINPTLPQKDLIGPYRRLVDRAYTDPEAREKLYSVLRAMFSNIPKNIADKIAAAQTEKREAYLEKSLRTAAPEFNIVGMMHAEENANASYSPLVTRISDLNPHLIRLVEAG